MVQIAIDGENLLIVKKYNKYEQYKKQKSIPRNRFDKLWLLSKDIYCIEIILLDSFTMNCLVFKFLVQKILAKCSLF